MTSAPPPASTQGAMMLVTLCLCCLWRGCKPYRENLQPEFSSSHWACLASDCPLREVHFSLLCGKKIPRESACCAPAVTHPLPSPQEGPLREHAGRAMGLPVPQGFQRPPMGEGQPHPWLPRDRPAARAQPHPPSTGSTMS